MGTKQRRSLESDDREELVRFCFAYGLQVCSAPAGLEWNRWASRGPILPHVAVLFTQITTVINCA